MKKVYLCFAIFILIFITSCSNNGNYVLKYNFKGENKDWVAEYKANLVGEFYKKDGLLRYKVVKSNENFKLEYKGKLSDLSSTKTFEYSFGGMSSKETFDNGMKKKVIQWSNEGTNGFSEKNDVEKLTVSIDGKVETFDMINKK